MKSTLYLILLFVVGTFFFSGSCSKGSDTPGGGGGPTDPCSGVTVTVNGTVVDASIGLSNGSITVTSPTGTGVTYSINGGAFVSTTAFANLATGVYTITAKTAAGCTGSRQFTVSSDACAGKTIVISTTSIVNNVPCAANQSAGEFTVSASGSTGFTYSVGSGAFQAGGTFTGLASGNYTVNAKDADGCIKSATVNIGNASAGPLFSAVRSMMQTNCAISGCHIGAAPTGGLNFSNDCTIVANWDRIKARAVDANPSQMPPPPNPALSNTDKQKILDWIAAGHLYTN